ncbi:MAG: methylphosphotriester-DNA--protein-cysteine methyltransferase [Thermoproteota archaeon]|jgi:methylphosphotriester-DNA--protein-cysteine methyltransferase
MTTRTMNRLFIKEIQLGPKKIQQIIRTEKVKTFLKKLSLTEVTFEFEFKSLSQFITVLKNLLVIFPINRNKKGPLLRAYIF